MSSFSQDLIVKKDSSIIKCQIIQIDSFKIHFIFHVDNKFGFINRSEVLTYYMSKSLKSDSIRIKRNNKFVSLDLGTLVGISFANFDTYNIGAGRLYIGESKNSMNFSFDLTLHFHKYFGLKATYFFQKNDFIGIDNSSLPKYLNQNKNVIDFKDEVTLIPWKIRGSMLGIVFMYPLIENFVVGTSAKIGFPLFTSPSYNYTFSYKMKNNSNNFNYNYFLSASQERKMAFSTSIIIKYTPIDRVNFNFEALYFYSNPEFYTRGEIDKPSYINGNEVRFYSEVRNFNFTIGISYDLIITQTK